MSNKYREFLFETLRKMIIEGGRLAEDNGMLLEANTKLLLAINAIQDHIRKLHSFHIIGENDMIEALKVISDNLKDDQK